VGDVVSDRLDRNLADQPLPDLAVTEHLGICEHSVDSGISLSVFDGNVLLLCTIGTRAVVESRMCCRIFAVDSHVSFVLSRKNGLASETQAAQSKAHQIILQVPAFSQADDEKRVFASA
jgi:hypothetical protein